MASAAHAVHEFMQEKARVVILLFVASEAVFFAVLISAYIYYTGSSTDGPNARLVLDPAKTGFYTVCLLSSSVTVWLAERAQRKNKRGQGAWLAATMALGLVFLYGEMTEYSKLLHENVTVSRDLFGSTFYTLTGFHAVHVTVGLILLGIALISALKKRSGRTARVGLECISYYWHFVDVVWVAVFSTVYLWSTR